MSVPVLGGFNFPRASRKDVRDAVAAARKAAGPWAARTAYNRGQILYRAAEMLDGRRAMITLRPQQGATKLTARMGLWGDEPLSRALMDRVGVRLGSLPPEAVPDEPPSKPASNPFFSRSAVSDEVMLRTQAEQRYHDATLIP